MNQFDKRLYKSFSLPISAIIIIPAILLILWPPTLFVPLSLWFILAMLVLAVGFVLVVSSVALFLLIGDGTPAPWDPPKNLVIKGVYKYTRNPMLTGAHCILLGEALLLGSWAILAWIIFFFVLNTVYFIFVEEPGLEKRFGQDYLQYKAHVPRWLPRLTPWEKT